MSDQLDVIILDDDPGMCALITDIVKGFYVWGDVHSFTDYHKALSYCKKAKLGVAIFILDVYLGKETAFDFLDAINDKYAWAAEDSIIVNICTAENITHLIEKPIKVYALKLAIRSIVGKYLLFAKRLLGNAEFAKSVANI
jgi:response regulator of citrate/malate metabolism